MTDIVASEYSGTARLVPFKGCSAALADGHFAAQDAARVAGNLPLLDAVARLAVAARDL